MIYWRSQIVMNNIYLLDWRSQIARDNNMFDLTFLLIGRDPKDLSHPPRLVELYK